MTEFTRYMVPSGGGIEAHARGLLYKRNDVDPEIERLTAERDRYKALSDELARLLTRYFKETPLGHQPHLIDEDTQKALAAYSKAREQEDTRIKELESLVEYAFSEGVRAGLSDVPGSRTWEESDSYRKLKGEET